MYDKFFKKYSEKYFGADFDWRWFRAQAIAESGIDPAAVSWCGAIGIMQIMPATFAEIQKTLPWILSVEDPEQNIEAGIFYDRRLYRMWSNPRPELDRLALMFASYNAGAGNILKAQKLCTVEPNLWSSIAAVAKHVPGWKSSETLGYVTKIMTLMSKQKRQTP
ncbi:MAG: transglycosylase SLT domain-containing protein [Desulfatirhabdiaceae bacterium]|nr:transglycosylase SLT domain-containing protein [Desulfatirhabdiaceae bacterium]